MVKKRRVVLSMENGELTEGALMGVGDDNNEEALALAFLKIIIKYF